jgi:hypothetical protein
MEREGRDASIAKAVLKNLSQTQAMYCEYHQKVLAAIDRSPL